ncbi:MAG: RND transporter [Spirochaetae bacterium HGW-Spirochaetae-3]|jgi:hypothetical protein|nr:MAG: RND transporter [Spirochaetae bacterium HGW-Spirochaetae-3]
MERFFKKPWLIIAVIVAATAVFSVFIPKIILDNEVKAYFPHDHASYQLMEKLDDVYGSQIIMDIAIETSEASVLTAPTIETIRRFTTDVEGLPRVDRVQSLTNLDYISAVDGGLSAETLVPADFGGSPEELEALRRRVVDWRDMYNRVAISDDFKATQVLVTIDEDITPDEMDTLYDAIVATVDAYEGAPLSFRLAGDPVLNAVAKAYMRSDLVRLIPLVILVVLLCLYFSFRTLEGMILPLLSVAISTIWTVGFMALTGAHFTVVSSCLPVVLIAVGSAYGIHVINHYYDDMKAESGELTADRHRDLVLDSLRKVAKPVFLAGLTTVAGFASNLTSPITPLKTFSIFSSFGVSVALLLSLTLIPALLIVKPRGKNAYRAGKRAAVAKDDAKADGKAYSGFVDSLFTSVTARRAALVAITAAIVAISTWGFTRLNIESSLITYFPADSQLRADVDYIDRRFAGSNSMSLLVSGPEKGDMTDPGALAAMDELADHLLAGHPEIGKIVSFSDFVRRMNKVLHVPVPAGADNAEPRGGDSGGDVSSFFDDAGSDAGGCFDDEAADAPIAAADSEAATLSAPASMADALALFDKAFATLGGGEVSADRLLDAVKRELNYDGAAYDELPVDPVKYGVTDESELKNLVSQYLLLYSGSLDQFANDPLQPSEVRMSVQLRSHSTKVTASVLEDAEAFAAARFPEGYTLKAAGIAELENSLSDMIIGSQISSIVVAEAAVFIILAIFFRSLIAGLIGSVPLLVSIVINYGIMGFAGINLDMVTSLISSIAIGIGIDYTIHLLSNYHQERLKSDDLSAVTRQTLRVSGKAVVVNAVSVGLGFLVLCLSKFVVLRYIGLLVAVVMLTSSVSALVILPLMLNIFKPAFISRPAKAPKGISGKR